MERRRPLRAEEGERDGEGTLSRCREENRRLCARWRAEASEGAAPPGRSAFAGLLRRLRALPAALRALPLELTVLYNSVLSELRPQRREELLRRVAEGLHRVLEASAVPGAELCLEDCWGRVLRGKTSPELEGPLHQLAVLQGLLWVADRPESVEGLFRLLVAAQGGGHCGCCWCCEEELLSLLHAWRPPAVGETDLQVVQNVKDLQGVLWASAAFLRGVQELESGDPLSALAFLQAAATGLCSKRVLAQIFTLMGCCNLKMGKPQTAAQHLKRSLQVDATFSAALYHAALLYRQLGLVEAELEALTLLFQALNDSTEMPVEPLGPHLSMHPELFIRTPKLTAFCGQKSASEVKYLLSQRCLQTGRASEAAEHYLDLLALVREGPLRHQVQLCGEPALPRIPEVFLEAASALEGLGRHQEAIAVCTEVVTQTSELTPERLHWEQETARTPSTGLALQESLSCVLWRAAAHLLQGWAWAGLGDAKEAVDHFSRCLSDLLRVQFRDTGQNSPDEQVEQTVPLRAKGFPHIRHLALLRRGAQFLEMQQDKKALMDFQHSLHVLPDSPTATLYLIYALLRLNRRQEAAVRWQKHHSRSVPTEEEADRALPLYLLFCVRQLGFPHEEFLRRSLEGEKSGAAPEGPSLWGTKT